MANPPLYEFPSPLEGYENLDPLPTVKQEDKSIANPQTGKLSEAYSHFISPLDNGIRGGFDLHIYYNQFDEAELKFAKELYERIRREFPELRIYTFWDRPVGPHVLSMFEVNVHTPVQFGAFVPWLAIHRGALSVLIHPNTVDKDEELRNHTQRAIWMGERLPLKTAAFYQNR